MTQRNDYLYSYKDIRFWVYISRMTKSADERIFYLITQERITQVVLDYTILKLFSFFQSRNQNVRRIVHSV